MEETSSPENIEDRKRNKVNIEIWKKEFPQYKT